MRALVGQPLVRTLDLRTGAVPLTGGAATYTLTPPNGAPVGGALPGEVLPGVYVVNLANTLLTAGGLYQESWVVTAGLDVFATSGWFVLTPWMPGLVARWELRHRVAQELRDLTLGTSAPPFIVPSTALVDPGRWEPDDHWIGAEAYLYGGVGRGQSRRVVDSVASTGTLTVASDWLPVPLAGTLYELHKRFTVDEYNVALERALSRHRHTVLLPIETSTLTTTRDQHTYAVPPPFDTLRKIEWQPAPQDWDPTRWCALEPGDWDLHAGRTLYLRCPHDATVRLLGEMAWDDLPNDDALTAGPVEWLVLRAAATLLASKLTAQAADAQGWREQLTYMEKAATDIEPRRRPRPSSRRVIA